MKKDNPLKNITFIFPVMGYFLLEALIVGLFIAILWKFFLLNYLGHIGYPQIVVLYWIAKMVIFNVFNLIGNLGTMEPPNKTPEQ